jgi:large subunit ribosomal protein L24
MNKQKEAPKGSKKIRKGDKVIVLAGNHRGATGTVLSCKGDRVKVQGVNIRKKHVKGTREQKGSILELEMPIHVSNLRVCTEEGKPVKLRVRFDEEGNRELYYKDGANEVLYRSVKTQ